MDIVVHNKNIDTLHNFLYHNNKAYKYHYERMTAKNTLTNQIKYYYIQTYNLYYI